MYMYMRFPGGKYKAVTFSYDDGFRTDIRLAQTLDKYGLKGTFNINNGYISEDPEGKWMTADDIRTHILDKGHEVANHGHHHWSVCSHRPIEALRDMLRCRLELEEKFGGFIRGMATPDNGLNRFDNGSDIESFKALMRGLDLAYCRTSTLANTDFKLPQDFWFWAPTIRHADPNVKDCIAKFKALTESKQYISETHPRLFFLWGHSWEFKKYNNWELLEEICQELSGMEDTWYATNMEIYEYTQAYNSLVYSADSLRVYNPTRIDVWFFRDRVTYCVKAGETITLPPPAPVCK